MDFHPTDEQAAVSELAATILRDRATPERVAEVAATADGFDRELWRALADANLLGLVVPQAHGGSGFGLVELCLLLEEQGRTVAPVPLLPTLALAALPVARFGTGAQQAGLLPGVAAGDTVLTGGLAERASDDPLRPAARATPDGGGWRLDGAKAFVPAADVAARAVVTAAGPDGQPGLFLVDPAAARLDRQVTTTGDALWDVHLDGTPAEAVVAPGPGAAAAVAWTVQAATVAGCAVQVGCAEGAVRMTASYTSGRRQFGRPIATFQAVQQRIADAYVDVQAMRVTALSAAWLLANDRPADEAVAVAKWWASDGGHRVAAATQHLHGGVGVDLAYPLHRYTRWSKQLEMTLGSAQPHLAALGDSIAAAYAAGTT